MITSAYWGEEGQEGPKCDYVIFECSLSVVLNVYFKAAGRRDGSVKHDTRSSSVSVVYFYILVFN